MTLRERIEKLNNGWDKEADDILQEIAEHIDHRVKIVINQDKRDINQNYYHYGSINIIIDKYKKSLGWGDRGSCGKNRAFKDALLWLLEKSGLESAKEGDKAEVEVEGKMWEAKLVRKL